MSFVSKSKLFFSKRREFCSPDPCLPPQTSSAKCSSHLDFFFIFSSLVTPRPYQNFIFILRRTLLHISGLWAQPLFKSFDRLYPFSQGFGIVHLPPPFAIASKYLSTFSPWSLSAFIALFSVFVVDATLLPPPFSCSS